MFSGQPCLSAEKRFEQKIVCLIKNRMLHEDSGIGSGLFYKTEINRVKLFLSGLEKSNELVLKK